MLSRIAVAALALFLVAGSALAAEPPRMRLRELGIALGQYPTGRWNAITDVAGVRVGQVTLSRGSGRLVPGEGPVRTGVTATRSSPCRSTP